MQGLCSIDVTNISFCFSVPISGEEIRWVMTSRGSNKACTRPGESRSFHRVTSLFPPAVSSPSRQLCVLSLVQSSLQLHEETRRIYWFRGARTGVGATEVEPREGSVPMGWTLPGKSFFSLSP